MSRIPYVLALGAALSMSAVAARAQQANPTPVPDLKPDLSSMSFMLGTWSCHSRVRGSARPDTVTNTLALDGRWIQGHDVAPPFDKYRSRAITTDSWTTYNPTSKKWITTWVDNFGNYGVASSSGWHGNQMTTTTVLTSDGSTGSDTMTKDGASKTTDVSNGRDKNGKAVPTTTTVCTKT